MITDALLMFSDKQDMTSAAANAATASTNVIDFVQQWDGGVSHLNVFAEWGNLPASATSGATVDVKVQVSTDAQNWNTLEEFPAVPIANATTDNPFLVRARLAANGAAYRYAQLVYTPSAALTSGTITAGINLTAPARRAYPRNYVA